MASKKNIFENGNIEKQFLLYPPVRETTFPAIIRSLKTVNYYYRLWWIVLGKNKNSGLRILVGKIRNHSFWKESHSNISMRFATWGSPHRQNLLGYVSQWANVPKPIARAWLSFSCMDITPPIYGIYISITNIIWLTLLFIYISFVIHI